MTDGLAKYAKAAIAIRDGFTREFVENYIAALLPRGWRIAGKLEMRPAFDRGALGGEYLFLSAENERFQQAGVKHLITREEIIAGVDLQAVAAAIANDLRADCESKGPGTSAIRFSLVGDGAQAPTRKSNGASGYDLYSPTEHYLRPGQILVVHMGVVLELPRGFEAQVRPRSSMSVKGLIVILGTIDSDFRGQIGATILNAARESQKIERGDRVAQLVISPVEHREFELVPVEDLSTTGRGSGGFGSTGR